jgi:hypothetical protein
MVKTGTTKKKSAVSNKKKSPSEPKAPPSVAIAKEIDKFIEHVDSLRVSFPATDAILKILHDKARRDIHSFLVKHYKKEMDAGKPTFDLKAEHVFRYTQLNKRAESALISMRIVPRSLLVALVSQFDSFLGGLLRTLFYLRPELLSSSEKQITFAELVEFGSVENAREHIIEKEIETVLRKSHADQFTWLENKFGLPLRKDLPAWKDFIELTERRNLFVHANGIVSGQYLKVCREHDVALEPPPTVGEQLDVSEPYFVSAYKTIYELGFKLGQVLWRQQHPQDLKFSDSNLNQVTYGLLKEEKFALATNFLDFATEVLKKHFDEENRLIQVVNRAQAYKWTGQEEKTIKILDQEDWSATGIEFKLTEAVLRDDFSTASDLMKRIGTSGPVTKEEYGEWPIFREFRKSKEFLEAFEEIFKEKFEVFLVEEEGLTLTIAASDSAKEPPVKGKPTPKRSKTRTSVSKRKTGH